MTSAQNLSDIKRTLRTLLPDLQERYGVASLALFGSYVRGDQRPESDLDVLVTFTDPPGLLRFIELEQELSERLGLSVDLVEKSALKSRRGRADMSNREPTDRLADRE